METCSIILSVVALIVGLYYFFTRGFDHFKKHGIPCRTPAPLFGNMWPPFFCYKSFAKVVEDVYTVDSKAKYVGMFDMMTPLVVLRDPELIKSVTVKNFDHFPDHRTFTESVLDPLFTNNLFALRGDRWREMRAIISPTFTSSKMKAMFKLLAECGMYFADFLATQPEDKREVDAKDAFTRYTNDAIATCAFGIRVDSMRDRENKFYVYGREATVFGFVSSVKFFITRSLPNVAKTLRLSLVRTEIAEFFKNLVADTIKTRDEQGIVRPDMIQLMMETRGKLGEGKELTVDEMTAQAFIFFFGGFESTSTLMCFAAYELAVNPEVQEKLQNEIDSVLEETNGELTYEALNSMAYLDAVLNEALRLYPVAPAGDRICVKPLELPPALPGLKPYMMKEKSAIWIPIYGLQRDPQYFENPDKFHPDRFIDDKKIANNGAYIPFGVGPRMCIGNRFALLETKVLLFHVLARCQLKPCAKTTIPMRLKKVGLSMTAENGFWMKIEPRSNPHPSFAAKTGVSS